MSPHQNFCWFAMFILLTVTTALPSNLTQENTNSSIFGRYQTMSNREQAYVSGGSLISFDDKLLAQEKSDILDSMLYAELTAGDVYNRNNNFVSWYKLYMEVLQETGWQIAGISLAQYKAPPHTYFTLLKVVWDLLAPLCQAVQREVLNRLLNVWKLLNDFDQRVLCFLTSSGHGGTETNAANFQIMPATRGNPGEVIIVFGGFQYQSNKAVQRFLTFSWSSNDISLYRSVVVAKFNSDKYSPYRRTLRSALGNRANSFIYEINL